MFKNEGHDKIDNDGASECKKGEINKIHPYFGRIDSKFLPPPFANAKRFLLKPLYYLINHDKQKYA